MGKRGDPSSSMSLPRLCLGQLWLTLGVSKALSYSRLAAFLHEAGLPVLRDAPRAFAASISGAEILLGVLLIAAARKVATSWLLALAATSALAIAAVAVAMPASAADCGCFGGIAQATHGRRLSLIHISEPTRPPLLSRMPSSA